jgi:hypothetical protein
MPMSLVVQCPGHKFATDFSTHHPGFDLPPSSIVSKESGRGNFISVLSLATPVSSPHHVMGNKSQEVQLFSATAVKCCKEQKATSFLMGQLSVAYGGTTEKLAQFFPTPDIQP